MKLRPCPQVRFIFAALIAVAPLFGIRSEAGDLPPSSGFQVTASDSQIAVTGEALDFTIRKKGYVSGIAAGTFLDKKTGFRDPGFGLDILDWLLEPGSDSEYRELLPDGMRYDTGNLFHGERARRIVEGPQICTQAKELFPAIVSGPDFVAVKQGWTYTAAAPGRRAGSTWEQTLVFPRGCRYCIAADKMTVVNASEAMAFRLDMPGHIRHTGGDTFSEIYLSYHGRIPSGEFRADFAPDVKFDYRRGTGPLPERFIRAYHLRDPRDGKDGPWLAGMTLNPGDVSEAWCHQRGYVCFIEEIGERPVKAGESFGAAYVIGYFDSVEEMTTVYDQFRNHSGLTADSKSWALTPSKPEK